MVNDNDANLARAAARKEVTFDLPRLVNSFPHARDELPVNEFRRRSSIAPAPPVTTTTRTEGRDDAESGDESFHDSSEDPIRIYDQFKMYYTESQDFQDSRYTTTIDDIREHNQEQASNLAAKSVRGNRPGFHFAPVTEIGKHAFPDFDGLMDQEAFDKAYSTNHRALFQELKVRALLAQAWDITAQDMHAISLAQDTHVGNLLDAVEQLHQERENDTTSLLEQIDDVQKDVKDEKAKLAEANQMIVDLIAGGRGKGSSSLSKKSAKVEVTIFYNDDKLDKVDFEVWYRAQTNRLKENHDWFTNDSGKMADIESHLGGTAAANLLPYLDEKHPERIKDSKTLMAHLKQEYTDHNKKEKARAEWANLELKSLAEFQTFKNDFTRLAGERMLAKTLWKEEFYSKLGSRMKNQVVQHYLNEKTDFKTLVAYAEKTAHNLKESDADQKKRKQAQAAAGGSNNNSNTNNRAGGRNAGQSNQNRDKPASGSGSSSRTGTPTQNRGRPSMDEMRTLMAQGRCFHCREHGHKGKECPNKEGKVDREARLAALFAQYGNGEEGEEETTTPATDSEKV
ncbi:hypothetical protein F4803DRAFT_312758 [Xylaria telfairii]|nr:hypothetical protein F4803DRAFT_312758 [Xylaria telfairii]